MSHRSNRPVEEIDLTLSSPEPEQRPRPQPPSRPHSRHRSHRQHPTGSVKTESRQARHRNMDHGRAGFPVQLPHQQIDPHHLARIIDTSDARALREVVINLCSLSPALAGAVARGLAPNSAFAQALIQRHGQAQSRRNDSQPHGNANSYPVSRPLVVKHEPTAPAPPPTPRRQVNPYAGASRPSPSANPPGSSTASGAAPANNRTLSNGIPNWAIKQEKRTVTKACQRCGTLFIEGSDSDCIFHPGRKKTVVDISGRRVPQYTCCQGGELDPPCEVGKHVAPTISALDSLKRPLPADERSPFMTPPRKSPCPESR